MGKFKLFRSTVIATVVGGIWFGREKRANAKKKASKTTVKYDYPYIDIATGKVKGIVIYKGKHYMAVNVDVHANTYEVDGSMAGLDPELQVTQEECIEHIRHRAKLFVDKVAA